MMLPKTICYVWLLVMGIVALRKEDAVKELEPYKEESHQ
jgi:hypothetical protein